MSEATAETEGKPATKQGGLGLLGIGLVANSVLLAGVVGFLAYQTFFKSAPAAPAAAATPSAGHGEEKPEEAKAGEHGQEQAAEGHGEKKGGEAGGGHGGGMGPLVKISDFVIHLRNPDVDRYARMTFDIEVFGDADKQALSASMPKVRDLFISYLSDRTVEELSGSENLGHTKEELQARLRRLVPDVRLKALYISDFVVQ